MTRALKYLEVELHCPTSNRYLVAKYRAGAIHHRLASLLHNAFRTEVCCETKITFNFHSIVFSYARRVKLVENIYVH